MSFFVFLFVCLFVCFWYTCEFLTKGPVRGNTVLKKTALSLKPAATFRGFRNLPTIAGMCQKDSMNTPGMLTLLTLTQYRERIQSKE